MFLKEFQLKTDTRTPAVIGTGMYSYYSANNYNRQKMAERYSHGHVFWIPHFNLFISFLSASLCSSIIFFTVKK